MSTIGIELEFSDIRTIDAARIVQEDQGYLLSEWQDRYGPYGKPKLSYDRWHVMSDRSIENTDGTRCMWSYLDETGEVKPANVSKKSLDRQQWKGAELISPAVLEVEDLRTKLDYYLQEFKRAGAVSRRDLFNSLHVHVDISSLEWEELRVWPRKIYAIQDTLKELSTGWPKLEVFNVDHLDRLDSKSTFEDWWDEYLTYKGKKRFPEFDQCRKLIDISPRFNPNKSYKTVEVRCLTSSLDTDRVLERVEFARDLISRFYDSDIDKIRQFVQIRSREILRNYE